LREAEVLEVDDIALLGWVECFSLGDGVLSPVEVDASKIGTLGGQGNRRFLRLVKYLKFVFGIDFGEERIDRGEDEEIRGFDYSQTSGKDSPVRDRRRL